MPVDGLKIEGFSDVHELISYFCWGNGGDLGILHAGLIWKRGR